MSTFTLALKYFFIDLIGGVIKWPWWWYTQGLVLRLRWARDTIRVYAKMLALGVWIKNIFVPMFGQRDWQSRLISFFIRLVQIFARGLLLIVWSLVVIVAVIIYIALPPVVIIAGIYHLLGSMIAYA